MDPNTHAQNSHAKATTHRNAGRNEGKASLNAKEIKIFGKASYVFMKLPSAKFHEIPLKRYSTCYTRTERLGDFTRRADGKLTLGLKCKM